MLPGGDINNSSGKHDVFVYQRPVIIDNYPWKVTSVIISRLKPGIMHNNGCE